MPLRILITAVCAIGSVIVDSAFAAKQVSPILTNGLEAKCCEELVDLLTSGHPEQLFPIVIVLRERVPPQRIAELRAIPNRNTRRAAVTEALKSAADLAQSDLLELLQREQNAGSAARIKPLWIANLIIADVTPDLASELVARDDVARLISNAPVKVFEQPDFSPPPTTTGDIECGVDLMGAPRVWNELGITGRGALVAITDSGTCHTHPDLINQIWQNPGEIPDNGIDDEGNGYVDDIIGWNFEDDNNDPRDSFGHGTHTAGTMCGDGTNGTATGMAPGATLMIQRIGSLRGIQPADVWEAMEYSVDKRVLFMSMSFGWLHSQNPPRAVWREVSENTIAAGTGLVIAAGNSGNCCPPFDSVATPADVPGAITIGATNCNDVIAGFSSRGPVTWQNVDPYNDWPYPPGLIKPSVSAPGVNTVSLAFNCQGYSVSSGTSMAAPHVTGTTALIMEANPSLSPEEVKSILMDTAVDLGADGWDNNYGAGRVDAYAAVVAAIASNNRTVPDDFDVTRGVLVGGDLDDLIRSDDAYVAVQARRPSKVAAASVEIEVGARLEGVPAELSFTVEAATSGTPVRQRISLFNFVDDEWEVLDEREAPQDDTPTSVVVADDPGRFIRSEDFAVRARIGFHDFGVNFVSWSGRFDHAYWLVVE